MTKNVQSIFCTIIISEGVQINLFTLSKEIIKLISAYHNINIAFPQIVLSSQNAFEGVYVEMRYATIARGKVVVIFE